MPVPRVVMPLISEPHSDAVAGERPQFLDEPIIQLPGPLASEESNNFVASVNELRTVSPTGIDRVCQSYLPWVASIPGIFGEAHLLNRTLAGKWRQRRTGCFRRSTHDVFSLTQKVAG